jgi:phosphoserine aminotransferase
MAGLTFQWVKQQGGVAALQKINEAKANLLYQAIDDSPLFRCPVAKRDRSLMNVVFVTGDDVLDKEFIAGAKERGLSNLGGHRTVGGMRASIYNAMPVEGVQALVDYMKEFEKNHSK